MKPNRVFALVVGCLLVLPGIGLLGGGVGLGAAYAFDRDADGYFSATADRLESPTVAITAEDLDLVTDPGSPDWLLDRLDADVRLEVTGPAGAPLFVGIGPAADVDAYLAGVAHDQVIGSTEQHPRLPPHRRPERHRRRPASRASGSSPRPVPAPSSWTGQPPAVGGRSC